MTPFDYINDEPREFAEIVETVWKGIEAARLARAIAVSKADARHLFVNGWLALRLAYTGLAYLQVNHSGQHRFTVPQSYVRDLLQAMLDRAVGAEMPNRDNYTKLREDLAGFIKELAGNGQLVDFQLTHRIVLTLQIAFGFHEMDVPYQELIRLKKQL